MSQISKQSASGSHQTLTEVSLLLLLLQRQPEEYIAGTNKKKQIKKESQRIMHLTRSSILD